METQQQHQQAVRHLAVGRFDEAIEAFLATQDELPGDALLKATRLGRERLRRRAASPATWFPLPPSRPWI
jgi:hypothetical protein